MVEIIIKNNGNIDKRITIIRDSVIYTIPAGEKITVTLEDPTKDSIVLEP